MIYTKARLKKEKVHSNKLAKLNEACKYCMSNSPLLPPLAADNTRYTGDLTTPTPRSNYYQPCEKRLLGQKISKHTDGGGWECF